MFVKVAVNIPSNRLFTYRVPEEFQKDMTVGKRVLIPFGRRVLTGYVLEVMGEENGDGIKDIRKIIDPDPLFDASDIAFYRWVADYYLYPLGKALGEILPGEDLKSARRFFLSGHGHDVPREDFTSIQQHVIAALKSSSRGLAASYLKRQLKHPDFDRDLRGLRDMGIVEEKDCLNDRIVAPKTEKIVSLAANCDVPERLTTGQIEIINLVRHHGELLLSLLLELSGKGRSVIDTLIKKGMLKVCNRVVARSVDHVDLLGAAGGSFVPNEDQTKAIRGIRAGLDAGSFFPCLLHGVTGSGKTEVYFLAIEEVLRRERGGVLFLVPEIGLTPQLLGRLHERFPDEPFAVLHSGISNAVRYDQWRCIQRGDIRVVVGARSALFAPVRDLRLVIVDEEHDESYKQDDRMRYNARDLAVVKAKLIGATVVLGSATPAIQSYYNVLAGKYTCFSMPKRVEERPLPRIEIVDMRLPDHGDGGKDATPILSRPLKEALRETLESKKQTLLLLNRRGFSTIMLCRDCGHVLRCRNCDLTLTLHAKEDAMSCHYCDFTLKAASACPECGGNRISGYGVGTERLEEMIKAYFPQARVARMDRDTTARAGAHEGILRALAREEIDILVGTQMIAKGHDFPGVVLVGVISADTSLNIPDFRASEKTFQLLTQVSGRGGRGDHPGRVIIQTFNPGHYVLECVKGHNYTGFYDKEVSLRSSLSYPPYSRMASLHVSCVNKDKGWAEAQALGKAVREAAAGHVEVIGPAESPLARIRGRYRWQLLLRGRDSRILQRLIQDLLSRRAATGVDVKADMDPMNFM
ncbi:MAG: primosomal protein N' [Syntrophales bacterium]|nr:primosomal protein N' [Syntrophales bacterium]